MARLTRIAAEFPLSLTLSLALVIAPLAGCSEVGQLTSSLGLNNEDLTVSPDDPCGVDRATFAKSNDFFTADVLKSAGIGALLGGIGGAGIGGVLGGGQGALEGALAGSITGALASLTISYSQYVQQHYSNTNQMANGIYSDLTLESRARDKTITNFRNLRTCRFAQANIIKRELRVGQISRAAAEQQLATERNWFGQEIAVAQRWGVNMEQRDLQYQQATTELEAKAPPQRNYTTRRAEVVATETNPDKRQALQSQVGEAQAQSKVAFNLDTNSQGFNLLWPLGYA